MLLRTSMARGLDGSRVCEQFAADVAAWCSDSRDVGEDDADAYVEVMVTDSRHVAKRGTRVGQMKDSKRLGIVRGRPRAVADVVRAAHRVQVTLYAEVLELNAIRSHRLGAVWQPGQVAPETLFELADLRVAVRRALREEIAPKNIIMIGATGVGKTEIARRLAKLAQAPFIKVEASKFTEVGYVGRDVESIIRDLTELSIQLVQAEEQQAVRAMAEERAEERLLDALLPQTLPAAVGTAGFHVGAEETDPSTSETREKLRKLLRLGELEEREVELELSEESGGPSLSIMTPQGVEEMGVQFKDLLSGMMPKQTSRRRLKIADAREALIEEETLHHDRFMALAGLA